MTIENGNIISVNRSVYIDYPGGPWHDHFVDKKVLLLVKREPTNNGNMLCIDSKRKLYHVNANEVLEVLK